MSVISPSEAAEDRRFNAVKQNFTGVHIIVDDSQRERYNAALDRFTRQYKPEGNPTIEFLVSELAKATWQIERLEGVIAKTVAEKGDLCEEIRLLTRYLNGHRRAFYRAIKQITDARRQNFQEMRLGFKMEVETPLKQFDAQTRRINVAGRSSETKLFKAHRARAAPPSVEEHGDLQARRAAPLCACSLRAQRPLRRGSKREGTRDLRGAGASPFCACSLKDDLNGINNLRKMVHFASQ